MAELRTSVVLGLVDRITSPLRRITQSVSGLGGRMGLDRLVAQSKRTRTAIASVGTQVMSLGKNLMWLGGGAAAGFWGISKMVGGVAELGNEIKTSSERLGVSSKWLQEWMYVGKQFSVENDALIDGFKELGLRADEFVMTGQGGAAESFKRLGISVKDLRKTAGETDKILDLVMANMGKVENDAARQRIFDELFGGSGGEQMVAMFKKSRSELDAMRRDANANGAVISDQDIEQSRTYTRLMGDFGTMLTSIRILLAGALLPTINEWLGRLRDLGKANREAIAQDVLVRIKSFWSGLKAVWHWTSMAADVVGGFGNLIGIVSGLIATKLTISLVMATYQTGLLIGRLVLLTATMAGRVIAGVVSFSGALMGLAARAVPAAIMGVRALSLALITTPVGLIITGITALAASVYLIYKNWDVIADWFSGLWGSIKGFFDQGIGEIIIGLMAFSPAGLLLKAIDAVFEMFGARPLSEIGAQWINGLWDGVRGKFEQMTGWLKESVGGLTNWMPDWMTGGGLSNRLAAPVASAPPAVSLGAPMLEGRPSPLAQQGQKADVGGELRIKIDAEGRPRVESMKSNGGLGYSVESGRLGVVP